MRVRSHGVLFGFSPKLLMTYKHCDIVRTNTVTATEITATLYGGKNSGASEKN